MKFDSTFPFDIYKFLIKPLRDNDDEGILERYVAASQEGFEQVRANIVSLDDLRNPDKVPQEYVPLQAWLLGWTPEMSYVTEGLTDSEYRRLLTMSVPMWKTKTSAAGIVQMLRLFTGRDALVWDWFAFRPILPNALINNPILPNGTLPNDLSLSHQRLPGDPNVIGGVGDIDDGRYEPYVWLSDLEPGIFGKRLAHDLLQLNRPPEEKITLCCPDFLDDFHNGVGAFQPQDADFAPVYLDDLKAASFPVGSDCELNIDNSKWKSLSFSASVEWNHPADSTNFIMRTHVERDGAGVIQRGYELEVTYDGACTLSRYWGGAKTALHSVYQLEFSPSILAAVPGAFVSGRSVEHRSDRGRMVCQIQVGWKDCNTQIVTAQVNGEIVNESTFFTYSLPTHALGHGALGDSSETGKLNIAVTGSVPGQTLIVDNVLAYRATSQSRYTDSAGTDYWQGPPTAMESYRVTAATASLGAAMTEAEQPVAPPSEKARSIVYQKTFNTPGTGVGGGWTNTNVGMSVSLWHLGEHRSYSGNRSAGYGTGGISGVHSGNAGNVPNSNNEGHLVKSSPVNLRGWTTKGSADTHKLYASIAHCWSKSVAGTGTNAEVSECSLQVESTPGSWHTVCSLAPTGVIPVPTENKWTGTTYSNHQVIDLSTIPTGLAATPDMNSYAFSTGTFGARVVFKHTNGIEWTGSLWVDDITFWIEER